MLRISTRINNNTCPNPHNPRFYIYKIASQFVFRINQNHLFFHPPAILKKFSPHLPDWMERMNCKCSNSFALIQLSFLYPVGIICFEPCQRRVLERGKSHFRTFLGSTGKTNPHGLHILGEGFYLLALSLFLAGSVGRGSIEIFMLFHSPYTY